MATYAVGDIQGCMDAFSRLLGRIAFDPSRDRLWIVGDLVNRGPRSLEVLRTVRQLGDRASCVLGNHDLHLVALSEGISRSKRGDTLDAVLDAPDGPELVDWLAHRPLLVRAGQTALVHAGFLPEWTLDDAAALADEAGALLRGPRRRELLRAMQEPQPPQDVALARARRFIAVATRLRTVDAAGEPVPGYSGPPQDAPPGCTPWYLAPGRKSRDATIVFGHWSALGLLLAPGLVGLDTGCVWGRELTAVRLDDRAVFQVPAFAVPEAAVRGA